MSAVRRTPSLIGMRTSVTVTVSKVAGRGFHPAAGRAPAGRATTTTARAVASRTRRRKTGLPYRRLQWGRRRVQRLTPQKVTPAARRSGLPPREHEGRPPERGPALGGG